jgi:hypothetical protein
VKLFCQTIYQNDFSSADIAVHGAETPKNSFPGVKWNQANVAIAMLLFFFCDFIAMLLGHAHNN